MFWTFAGNRSAAPTTIMLSSGRSAAFGALVALTLGLVATVAEGRLVERFVWSELQFDWPSAEVKEAALQSGAVS